MTIAEAINAIDTLKANAYSEAEKVMWLSECDGTIFNEIISTHEDGAEEFTPFCESTPRDTQLIAEHPYDSLYLHWLEAKIDYYNGEYGKYNNSNAMFTADMTAYRNFYNREHMPKGGRFRFF